MTEIFSTVGNLFSETTKGIFDSVVDTILYGVVYKLFYWVGTALTWVLQILYSVFEVFSGTVKVSYDGAYDYLSNVFFSNTLVTNIYWGMALIGFAMCFGFAIFAVARKMFDADQKQQRSTSQILTSTFKSCLIIFGLNIVMTVTLNATNVLLQQVAYLFNNSSTLHLQESIEFNDEQYAAMARVLNTVGNYSLNPSYTSRYNINSCYNEIRSDLDYLSRQGVFSFYYGTATDADGNIRKTWQSELQKLVNAGNPRQDLKMDVYYEEITKALTNLMDEMRTDASFAPLKSFDRKYAPQDRVPLDTLVFLMSTLRAAKNPIYNEDASLTDPVRGPYFAGDKSIYDLDSVNADFDISPSKFDYLILYLGAYLLLLDVAGLVLVCATRLFNLLLLYLAAPPFIATMPMDDGAKFRQWTTAFVIQTFGMFGSVISMRIFLIFLPIVTSSSLHLFDNLLLDNLAKLILILGAAEAVKRSSGMITGILADQAGMEAIRAGDVSGMGRDLASKGFGLAGAGALAAGGFGAKVAWGATKLTGQGAWAATKAVGYGTVAGAKWAGRGISSMATGMYDRIRGRGSTLSAGETEAGSSVPKPPPIPVRNAQGQYVPTPPPMPANHYTAAPSGAGAGASGTFAAAGTSGVSGSGFSGGGGTIPPRSSAPGGGSVSGGAPGRSGSSGVSERTAQNLFGMTGAQVAQRQAEVRRQSVPGSGFSGGGTVPPRSSAPGGGSVSGSVPGSGSSGGGTVPTRSSAPDGTGGSVPTQPAQPNIPKPPPIQYNIPKPPPMPSRQDSGTLPPKV